MSRLADWMCTYLRPRCSGGPQVDEVAALTQQFHVTLRAHITRIEEQAPDPPPKALERIRAITAQDDDNLSWKDAYDIEQQLVPLYDAPTVRIELERRLLEADRALPQPVTNWYRNTAKELTTPPEQTALLSRLINDLQWRYTMNEAKRGYTKDVTTRTERVYMLAFGLFLFALVPTLLSLASDNSIKVDNPWLFACVALAGAFGAAFSMMISMRSRYANSSLDDLKLNRTWGMIFARVLVGIGAGFILFFFIRSGLLGGEAFPQFSADVAASSGTPDSTKGSVESPLSLVLHRGDFAKLFIWCFLAGFSEKLVPSILDRTEARRDEEDRDTSQNSGQTNINLPAAPTPLAPAHGPEGEGSKPAG